MMRQAIKILLIAAILTGCSETTTPYSPQDAAAKDPFSMFSKGVFRVLEGAVNLAERGSNKVVTAFRPSE
jgi:PBP1b-binding outer membrane lipoprotein LpoB